MFTLSEIYRLGMRIEENGETFYRKALARAQDQAMGTLLTWLAEEEVAHKDWFEKRAREVEGTSSDKGLAPREMQRLQDILGNQTFSLGEADLSRIHSVQEMVRLAIEFEEDTLIFFNMIASLVTDLETLKGLRGIIEEEERHVALLKEKAQGDGFEPIDPQGKQQKNQQRGGRRQKNREEEDNAQPKRP